MPSLRKYMAYSFAGLWTVVLIIALVVTIIHQVRLQDSSSELHLQRAVSSLELQNQNLRDSLDKSEIKYDNYREWVLSWR